LSIGNVGGGAEPRSRFGVHSFIEVEAEGDGSGGDPGGIRKGVMSCNELRDLLLRLLVSRFDDGMMVEFGGSAKLVRSRRLQAREVFDSGVFVFTLALSSPRQQSLLFQVKTHSCCARRVY
jgi:hypothetical protein